MSTWGDERDALYAELGGETAAVDPGPRQPPPPAAKCDKNTMMERREDKCYNKT